MAIHIRRREFVFTLGGVAAAWPLAARAQQPGKSPTIGFLGATTPTIWGPFVGAFLQRLRELGWIDGRDIAIEYRWAEGRDDRYAAFAAEIVQRRVDVIVTAGTYHVRQESDVDNPDSFCFRWRPGRDRAGRQPGAPGRQCHRSIEHADRSWRPQT